MKNTLIIGCLLIITGCSIVPYEEEYACRRKDNLGKCISAMEAYDEAVSGSDTAPYLKPASEQESNTSNNTDIVKPKSEQALENNTYSQYLNNYYSELRDLVGTPNSPMVKEAKKIRTLVLPYSTSNKVVYMDRYIYSLLDEPLFIMGNYLTKESVPVERIINQ